MTLFEITAFYIALFILMNLYLMLRVGLYRNAKKISLGDNDDKDLRARIRAHGNYTETIIFSALALITLSQLSAPSWLLHLIGTGTLIGRIAHFIGMQGKYNAGPGRPLGMFIFLATMLISAGYIFYSIFMS